jgi:hypothetical protein
MQCIFSLELKNLQDYDSNAKMNCDILSNVQVRISDIVLMHTSV